MSGLGAQELIVILIVLALLITPVVIAVVATVVIVSRKKRQANFPHPSTVPTQGKLQDLENLLAQNLISQAEYDEKRKQIIDAI